MQMSMPPGCQFSAKPQRKKNTYCLNNTKARRKCCKTWRKNKPIDRHNQNIFTKNNTINMQKSGNKKKSISRIFSTLLSIGFI